MVDTMEGLALSAPMQRLKSGGQTNGLATAIQRREQMMLPPSLLEIGVAMVIQVSELRS